MEEEKRLLQQGAGGLGWRRLCGPGPSERFPDFSAVNFTSYVITPTLTPSFLRAMQQFCYLYLAI
jgi:hypothetical protein